MIKTIDPNLSRPVIFGEVLFDHFPDDSVILGGAPFNVAWHLQAFGACPLFISRVGDDQLGNRIRSAMQDWDMDTSGLQMDSKHPTGTVQIEIENGEPSYEIVPDQAYDFIDADDLPPVTQGSLLYHGSLALRNSTSRDALEELHARLDLPIFIDVNLRTPWWHRDIINSQLNAARWAKLNDEELRQLSLGNDDDSLESQAEALQEASGVSLLIVTCGEKGALARTEQGVIHHVEPEPGISVVDTVGAGDAFTSVILLGLFSGWDLDKSLHLAQSFASAVVGIRGATPTDKEFYNFFTDIQE